MFQLIIEQCLRDEADALSDICEEMGAVSVTMTDRYDSPILEPEIGTTPLWADVVVHALFQEVEDAELARSQLLSTHPHLTVALEPVPEKDWERVCMDDFKPQQFGKRLWICPSWHTPPDPDGINLTLDPGLAFGTGTHPTTALCLTWLEQASLTYKRLIDFGCGSGVLALAALKLGAAHVDAVDLDEQALIATQNNAALNQIHDSQLTVSQPERLSEPADILVANILLTPLLQLKTEFHRLLKSNGILVVSGVLSEQVAQLITEYAPMFIHHQTEWLGDWGLVVFKPIK